MLKLLVMLLAAQTPPEPSFFEKVINFIDTPLPYSPFSEYLLVLFILWLFARRASNKREDFSGQAQEVLEDKLRKGEIDQETYEKYRQEVSLRLKKE